LRIRCVWPDEDFEGAALNFFGLEGVNEMAGGQNDGARLEYLGLPMVGKAAVKKWGGLVCGRIAGHGFAL
jgi:hypothetical protein